MQYVGNIYKYYIAYSLLLERNSEVRQSVLVGCLQPRRQRPAYGLEATLSSAAHQTN